MTTTQRERSAHAWVCGIARRFARGLLVALPAASAGCEAPPAPVEAPIPPEIPAPTDVHAVLNDGDVLAIALHGHADMSSGELGTRIDREGNVDLPMLGPIQVRGLTISEARDAIRQRAARFVKSPSVSVSVLSYEPRPFYVLGAVQTGGPFPVERPLTALQALSMAGGYGSGADLEQVALLRTVDRELVVHFFNAETPGVEGLVGVYPGDVLFVRRSGAGTFREEIMPYLQGVAAPLSAIASLIVVSDVSD